MDQENKLTELELECEYEEKRSQIIKEYRDSLIAIDDNYRQVLSDSKNNLIIGIEYWEKKSVESWEKKKKYVSTAKGDAEIETNIAHIRLESNIAISKILRDFYIEIARHDYEHDKMLKCFERDNKLDELNKEHDEKLAHAGYPVEELPMPDMSLLFNSLKKVAAKSAIDEDELQKLNETLDSLQQKAEELELM